MCVYSKKMHCWLTSDAQSNNVHSSPVLVQVSRHHPEDLEFFFSRSRKIKENKKSETMGKYTKYKEKYKRSRRANEDISYLIYVLMRTETKNEKCLGWLQERQKILDCILFRLRFSFLQETEKKWGEE